MNDCQNIICISVVNKQNKNTDCINKGKIIYVYNVCNINRNLTCMIMKAKLGISPKYSATLGLKIGCYGYFIIRCWVVYKA